MNYNIKIALDKIKGAHVVENFKTRAGEKKAIVIIIDENKSIVDSQFGIQLQIDMVERKENGKRGSHFIRESKYKDMPKEEADSRQYLGNAWESGYGYQQPQSQQNQPQPAASQGNPYSYHPEVEDLPF